MLFVGSSRQGASKFQQCVSASTRDQQLQLEYRVNKRHPTYGLVKGFQFAVAAAPSQGSSPETAFDATPKTAMESASLERAMMS